MSLGYQPASGLAHDAGLTRGEGLDRVDPAFTSGLYLDGDDARSETNHEIDLSPPRPGISHHYIGAATNQEILGMLFPELRQRPGSQMRGWGSSSSMFTSRKLITRTFLRKRAGRYMSHTQASSRSISK